MARTSHQEVPSDSLRDARLTPNPCPYLRLLDQLAEDCAAPGAEPFHLLENGLMDDYVNVSLKFLNGPLGLARTVPNKSAVAAVCRQAADRLASFPFYEEHVHRIVSNFLIDAIHKFVPPEDEAFAIDRITERVMHAAHPDDIQKLDVLVAGIRSIPVTETDFFDPSSPKIRLLLELSKAIEGVLRSSLRQAEGIPLPTLEAQQ